MQLAYYIYITSPMGWVGGDVKIPDPSSFASILPEDEDFGILLQALESKLFNII